MPNAQQAVWHNGGCNSAERFVRTWTFVPRITDSVPRHCAKPPPRCMQFCGQYSGEMKVVKKTENNRKKTVTLQTEKTKNKPNGKI